MCTKTVRIITDSTCDLTDELVEQYGVTVAPLCIVLDDKSYFDKVEITPDEIYTWANANKKTPKTAAMSMEYFRDVLAPFMEADEDVIFIGISMSMSTTCNVARLIGEEFDTGRLFVVDSMNLSTGVGLQVLKAAELVAEGKSAEEIVAELEESRGRVRASFVVDNLTYLARGGRCSGATAMVANTLQLHPCIQVADGKMDVGKKYRGNMKRALKAYVSDLKETLAHAERSRVFITHSGIEEEIIQEIYDELNEGNHFEEILITRAGGVISSHCGPGTLGVLFYEEK